MGRKKYIDQTDINLINALKANPEFSIARLGEEIDLSPGPTHTRINHLKKEGILTQNYKIRYEKLGMDKTTLFFMVKRRDEFIDENEPYRYYDEIVTLLKGLEFSIVESVIHLWGIKNRYWVSIVLYPLDLKKAYGGKYKNQNPNSFKTEISNVLDFYIVRPEQYFMVEQSTELKIELSRDQRLKTKPRMIGL